MSDSRNQFLANLIRQRDVALLIDLLTEKVIQPGWTSYQLNQAVKSALTSNPMDWSVQEHDTAEAITPAPAKNGVRKLPQRAATSTPRAPLVTDGISHADRLLRYAREHNGEVKMMEYYPWFEAQTGVPGKPIAGSIFGAAKALVTAKLFEKVQPGHWKLTARGRQYEGNFADRTIKRKGKTIRGGGVVPDDDMLQFATHNGNKLTVPDYSKDFMARFGRRPSNGFIHRRLQLHIRNRELATNGDGVYRLQTPHAAARAATA